MFRILPAIDSLDQHLYHLEHHPQAYRPAQCPHCGLVHSEIEVFNQHGVLVMTMKAVNVVACREK